MKLYRAPNYNNYILVEPSNQALWATVKSQASERTLEPRSLSLAKDGKGHFHSKATFRFPSSNYFITHIAK